MPGQSNAVPALRQLHTAENAVARWRAILRAIHRLIWIGAYTVGFAYSARSIFF